MRTIGSKSTTDDSTTSATSSKTTVEARFTGHVRTAIGTHRLEYSFEGETLREFLDAFFDEYDVRELVMATRESDSTTRGWVKAKHLPGTWRKNPEGEQTRAYARVMINGVFNENLNGLDTHLEDGDRVALVYPFMFCV
ncbi:MULTISPECIES: MoaD/ThiS family protein [Haloferax]|uniref:Pterin cluster protein n=2 Tax=Haloferax TaxID=2251 RepID=A0A6G1YY62_9EURY|nr:MULTISPECIES: MoaD/ThiS family protein [Haloferax]KAB1186606.1 MoaD/ThiS family protein [Haloferax sp. CBA1149]MRW79222.1 pterin cluster protein [Haloferax marinisediminis]